MILINDEMILGYLFVQKLMIGPVKRIANN